LQEHTNLDAPVNASEMIRPEGALHMPARALTIAGFDPSGGAGVLADARTFDAFGFRVSGAVTSVTFQNSLRVFGALHQTAKVVRAQVESLLDHDPFACAKTGMLPTSEVVQEVARLFRETDLPAPVVDPVIISTSGHRLMEENAIRILIDELLPLARLVTPNIPEAERLTGLAINSEDEMQGAASRIREMGARAVLIKGGHLGQEQTAGAGGRKQKAAARRQEAETDTADGSTQLAQDAVDLLDNEGKVTVFRGPRIPNVEMHGSGCILSAAIAAGIGQGRTLEESVETAKRFVLEAIRSTTDS
jgi:hydroxymethylpyrimidine kinase/phosphomethylpyrimidine kinase